MLVTVEANLSGDKKASAQSFLAVRGKKVTAEVRLPAVLVEKVLHTTPARMVDYWRMSESAVGVTRFDLNPDGGLYAAVTLPNLIVGTVGGGTGLPSQRAYLELMGLAGSDHARAFAETGYAFPARCSDCC